MISEEMATDIFVQAISECRAAELLNALFDGGTCTIDRVTGRLVIIPATQLQGMIEE